MKKTMPPTFHRILTTTALCLAAVGVNKLHLEFYTLGYIDKMRGIM